MKRQLTKEEKEITTKNLKFTQEELEDIEKSLAYNEAILEKNKYLKEFQTKWADYLYNQKDKEDNRLLEAMRTKIEQSKEAIKLTETQLVEGVEVMENSAVK